ncbi:hypothetical protein DAI22_01g177000 [Oryza sativa Japonica Group]|jgi:hypothetical protein|nr:hypothetical protein DAI22_01g177000 [Oryza sativa Japonica Group]
MRRPMEDEGGGEKRRQWREMDAPLRLRSSRPSLGFRGCLRALQWLDVEGERGRGRGREVAELMASDGWSNQAAGLLVDGIWSLFRCHPRRHPKSPEAAPNRWSPSLQSCSLAPCSPCSHGCSCGGW